MIGNFKPKGLRQLYEEGNAKGVKRSTEKSSKTFLRQWMPQRRSRILDCRLLAFMPSRVILRLVGDNSESQLAHDISLRERDRV